MRTLRSSKIFVIVAAIVFAIAGSACSDDDGPTPEKNTVKEAGAETSPDKGVKEGGAETSPDMAAKEGGAETSPDIAVGETSPDTGADAAAGASFSFHIEGSQEVPAVTTSASGNGKVTINAAETEITVEITYTNLTGISAAHIHTAAAGANGGVIFTLASATFTSPFTKKLTSADFSASGSVTSFASAIAAIKAGNTYINIHTSGNASGEIRGQIKN